MPPRNDDHGSTGHTRRSAPGNVVHRGFIDGAVNNVGIMDHLALTRAMANFGTG